MSLLEVACPRCRTLIALAADAQRASEVQCDSCGFSFSPQSVKPIAPSAPKTLAQTQIASERDSGTLHNAYFPPEAVEQEAIRKRDFYFLSEPQQPDELGRLGGYRILRELGRGGMGIVFEAEDGKLKRRIALKVMLPTAAANQEARLRFLREAQSAAALEHDNVVAIYQVGEDDGVPFIAMPLLKGETLETRLNREGNLPTEPAARIGRQIAEGMAAAHQLGLVHRDIKPGNIWLEEPRDRVKILDFGLARLATVSDSSGLTNSGVVLGTPGYMAPEQVRAGKSDARSDLFSLGCVLYRMVTGEHPFQAHDLMSSLMALALDDPKRPQLVNPSVPTSFDDVIMKLLAKNPEDRPASASVVAEKLGLIAPSSAAFNSNGTAHDSSLSGVVVPPPLPLSEAAVEPPPLPPPPPPSKRSVRPVEEKPTPLPPPPPASSKKHKKGEAPTQAISTLSLSLISGTMLLVLVGVVWISGLLNSDNSDKKSNPNKNNSATAENLADDQWLGWPPDAPAPAIAPFPAESIANFREQWSAYYKIAPEMEIPLSTDNPVPLKLVFIPPGEFSMGSPEPEVGRKPDEKLHPVRITRGFYLSVTEITQAQWEAVMHTAPWKGKPQVQEGTTLPAVCIGWEQANEFCRTLSALEKKEFRLPTEAEWEYAHRAGGKTTYSFGDDPAQLTEFAWFREEPNATTAQHKFAQPVGTKAANPFGLYDMNGNVWEWCFDHYDKKYYEASPENNPQGPTSGSFCVRRGGSWQSDPTIFRAAYRSVESPSNTNVVDLGFRLAMSVGETPSALETGSATDQEATNSGND